VGLTSKRGLHFFFILLKRSRLSSYLRFVERTLLSHSLLFSITCTIHHRRDYDERKVVVVV